MNQLPIPASGARTARFGSLTPPISNGSVISGTGLILPPRLEADPPDDARLLLAVPDEQRERVVPAVHRAHGPHRHAPPRRARVDRRPARQPRPHDVRVHELHRADHLLLLLDLDEAAADLRVAAVEAVAPGRALRAGGAILPVGARHPV